MPSTQLVRALLHPTCAESARASRAEQALTARITASHDFDVPREVDFVSVTVPVNVTVRSPSGLVALNVIVVPSIRPSKI